MSWIKWWKDKTFMSILSVALGVMLVSFLLSYFLSWGWIPAMMVVLLGGIVIRKILVKRFDEISEDYGKGDI